MTYYRIVRMFLRGPSRKVRGMNRLTLEQAQAHCADPETSSRTCTRSDKRRITKAHGPWFEGYEVDA